MRRTIVCISILLGLTLGCGTATAQATKSETEIRQLLSRFEVAFRAKDLNAVMAFYAPGAEFVGFDIAPPLKYSGKEAYQESYKAFFAQYEGPLDLELRDLTIVTSGNIAFGYGLERIGGTLKSGEKSSIWVRATTGLRKIHGAWRIVHDHISVPVDFDTGKALLDLTP